MLVPNFMTTVYSVPCNGEMMPIYLVQPTTWALQKHHTASIIDEVIKALNCSGGDRDHLHGEPRA